VSERQRAEGGTAGDPFAEYDAAYVLGSLSPQDRQEFEAHLQGCRQCTAAVAALAGLPGLLSTVSAPVAERIAELGAEATPPVPETLRPRLLTSVRKRRRLRTVIQVTTAGLVAAACLVLGLFIARPPAAPVPDVTVAMQGPDSSPMDITVSLREVGWGTRMQVKCKYRGPAGEYSEAYRLMVVEPDGSREQVASWNSVPGASTATVDAGTALRRSQIALLEIAGPSGQVLMTAHP